MAELARMRHAAFCHDAARPLDIQPLKKEVVPLAGIEPALLAELDFESSASTSSATGAFVRGPEAGAAKRAEYSGQPARVNPRGCDCGVSRHPGGGGIGRCCLFEHGLCSGERP